MSKFNLSHEKYDSLRGEYEEYLNIRHAKYLRLRNDAICLLNEIESMFSSEILDKVELVSYALNKC